MLIGVNGLTKSFGDNLLFDGISFSVEPNDIIGLIGENGAGKTTLFNILTGDEPFEAGGIVRTGGISVGVLQQHACQGSILSAYDETLKVFEDLIRIENELNEVNLKLETSSDSALIAKQLQLQERFEREGGLTYRSRTAAALHGIGLTEEEQRLSVASLSGGQRSKVELCKLLLSCPDVILLDEPTNHLDIDAIEWLDGYIKNCKRAVMIISHDRYFLDRVANKIFELDNHRLYTCNGNYTKCCAVREERKEAVRHNYQNTMREVDRIERIIEQQRRWNREKNIKTAENKQKMIDRLLEGLEVPDSEKENITLSFSSAVRSGDEVLKAQNLKVAFEDKLLYEGVSLDVRRGERIFIIGPNGCGKTTLLGQLKDKTLAEYGTGVSVGYFDQHQRNLNLGKTVFQQLRDDYPRLGDTAIRSALALFLFKGDEVFQKIESLSGGERARVALCRLMLAHNNLLLLDEPTNHLDLESREILEEALDGFDGTLICVSHDRYLINRLATSIMYFDNKTVKTLNGNYDDYLGLRTAENPKKTEVKTDSAAKNDYLKRKQDAAALRKAKTALKRCEESVAETESKLKEINQQLASDEVISDYVKVSELTEKAAESEQRLTDLLEEWELLSKMLEEGN